MVGFEDLWKQKATSKIRSRSHKKASKNLMGQGLRDELIKQRFYIIKVFLKKKKTDTEILPLMAKYRIYMSVLLF